MFDVLAFYLSAGFLYGWYLLKRNDERNFRSGSEIMSAFAAAWLILRATLASPVFLVKQLRRDI